MTETSRLEMSPLFKVKGDSTGYHIFFHDNKGSFDFVENFWTNYSDFTRNQIINGKWRPEEMPELTHNVRTQIAPDYTVKHLLTPEEQSEGWASCVYLSGNNKPLDEKTLAWLHEEGYLIS